MLTPIVWTICDCAKRDAEEWGMHSWWSEAPRGTSKVGRVAKLRTSESNLLLVDLLFSAHPNAQDALIRTGTVQIRDAVKNKNFKVIHTHTNSSKREYKSRLESKWFSFLSAEKRIVMIRGGARVHGSWKTYWCHEKNSRFASDGRRRRRVTKQIIGEMWKCGM